MFLPALWVSSSRSATRAICVNSGCLDTALITRSCTLPLSWNTRRIWEKKNCIFFSRTVLFLSFAAFARGLPQTGVFQISHHKRFLHPTRSSEEPSRQRLYETIVAAREEVPNHRTLLQNVEILVVWPLRGTPSSGHASTGDGKAFDRRSQARVVISSIFCLEWENRFWWEIGKTPTGGESHESGKIEEKNLIPVPVPIS